MKETKKEAADNSETKVDLKIKGMSCAGCAANIEKRLNKLEGITSAVVNLASGAAVYAVARIAKRPEHKGRNIVVLLPDTGERYLSTELFQEM